VNLRSRVFTFPEDLFAFSNGDSVPSFDNTAFGDESSLATPGRRLARRNFNGENWFEEFIA
jgi:hypothetical protein